MGRECSCGRRAVPEDSRKGKLHRRADLETQKQGCACERRAELERRVGELQASVRCPLVDRQLRRRGRPVSGPPHQPAGTLAQLIEASWATSRQLGPPLGPTERFACLVEEVGELAEALLAHHDIKRGGSPAEDLPTAIAGVLFDLLVLAHQHGVDLERTYADGLAELAKRAGGRSGCGERR